MVQSILKRSLIFYLLFSTSVAVALPTVEILDEYYRVTGTSKSELLQSLGSKTPIRQNGEVFYGRTRWDIVWDYSVLGATDECRIDAINTKVSIQLLLPQLESNHTLPPPLKKRWDNYISALVEHETDINRWGSTPHMK